MLTIPKILDTPEFYDAPLDYKWDEKASDFYSVDAEKPKLENTLDKLNYKAAFGIATALCEWIYWRMHKYIDKPGIPLALEAQWAGLINKHYFYCWSYEGDYISDPIYGPTYSMWQCVQFITYNYEQNNFCTNDDICRLAIIARHICPDKKFFDNWLSDALKKSTKLFFYKETVEEPIILKQFFFEDDYNYQTADNIKIINNFLSTLEYKKNNFLNSPEKMLELNFQGTPYKYELK